MLDFDKLLRFNGVDKIKTFIVKSNVNYTVDQAKDIVLG